MSEEEQKKFDKEKRRAQRRKAKEAKEGDSPSEGEVDSEATIKDLQKQIKKLERELKRERRATKAAEALEKELREQRKELDEILNAHLVYVVTDKELNIEEVSSAFTQMFGYAKKEIFEQKATKLIAHESMDKFLQGCEHVSKTKRAWATEVEVLDINFKLTSANIFIYPLVEANVLKGFVFIIEDITKEKLLQELRRKLAKLERFNADTVDFFTDTAAAVINTIDKKISITIKIIVGFIILFLLYAYNFDIDDIATGDGKFIPATKIKHLKHLEGGVVTAIFVKEGDIVKKGQVLVTLNPIQFQTKYNENKKRLMQLKAKMSRLKAEYSGEELKKIDCVIDGEKCEKKIVQDELNLYRSDILELQRNISKQLEQLKAKKSELKDAKTKYKSAKENYESLKEEYDAKKSLLKDKIFSLYEIKNLRRDLIKSQTEMESAKESINQAKAKILEIKNAIEESKLKFKNKAGNEYNTALSEYNSLIEQQKNLKSIIKRTVVRSPVDGMINEMFVHTIGTSVPPGGEVLSIVPDTKDLVAEIKIKPKDIGKLHIGQTVTLKITAYDSSVYGNLKGKIVNISPDTIQDPKDRKEYYQIYVKTKTIYLDNNERYRVKVGMKVNASIVVGKKSIMSYLLKPILKSVQKQ